MNDDAVGPPRWVWYWLVGLAIFLVLALAATSIVVGASSIRHLDRQDCSDELEGAAWEALGDSLEAPPAPDPARLKATQELADAARRVGNTSAICGTD
jgi:hypothetical protein